MNISVTKTIALAGHNPYYQAIDAFYSLRPRHSFNYKIHNELLAQPLAQVFVSVPKVTSKMRQDSRRLVNKLCKKHGITHSKPYGIFARHRGRVLEHRATALIRRLFEPSDLKVQVPTRFHAHGFTFRGRADCLLNGNTVIEIKCRMYRFMKAKPFELDQLALYCVSLQKDGLLIQYFDEQLHATSLSLSDAEERTHKVLQDAEWLFGSIRRGDGFPTSPTRPGVSVRRLSSLPVQGLLRHSS